MMERSTLSRTTLGALLGVVVLASGAKSYASELSMWVETDPNYEAAAKAEAAEYEKATGVHVKLSFVPWAQYGAKIAAAFQAGSQPDVIEGVGSWLYAQKTGGQLAELPADLASQMSGFDAASLKPVEWKDKYYGVPLNVNIDAGPFTLYNVTAFEKADVTPKWSTWDAYVADLKKLTTTSNGKITRSGVEMMGGDRMVQFLNYFLQAGGKFYSDDGKSVQINNKYGEIALQTMYDLLNVDHVDSPDLTDWVGIASGTAASVNYGPWYIATIKAGFPNFKWGWAALPLIPNAAGPYFPGTNVWAWMIPADSPNKAAAWDYVRWLNNNTRRLAWAEKTGEIPAVKALWSDQAVVNNPRWTPWLPYLKYQVPLLYVGPQDTYQTVLGNMVTSVLLKQSSIPAALKSAQDQLDQMIAGLPN
jgi:multiple sugar transport system substrate-binding protein